MRIETDAARWDAALLSLPAPHVLQSFAWGALKSRWGWSAERLVWEQGGRTNAAALLLHRRVGPMPVSVGYVPKGPLVVAPSDPELWAQVLTDLGSRSAELRLALVKIDPDVPADAFAVSERWRELGWRPSSEQIQFPNTMISELELGEDEILKHMKPKTRYNIRLAGRRGVTVRHGDESDLKAFYRLYRETALRDGFGIRVEDYYLDAWSVFLRDGRATLILAERDGDQLAGVLPVAFGPSAYFLYGATASHGRENMASYAAQWESLRWAKAQGCERYDWWGGPTKLVESDALWGVYRFKLGFGAVLAEQQGAFDLPVRPVLCGIYDRLSRMRYWMIGASRMLRNSQA